MPYISGFLIEGPTDPGYGQGHPGHRPDQGLPGHGHIGGGPIIPPTDPDYGRPTFPPHIEGGPIVPPNVVMPPIHIPPVVGGGPVIPPGAIWPPVRPPHAGHPLPPAQGHPGQGLPEQPGRPPQVGGGPVQPPGRPDQGLPGGPPGHVGGGPTATKYLAMVILATDGGYIRTAWTVIDTSLEWPDNRPDQGLPTPPGGVVTPPMQPTPEPKPGQTPTKG